MRSTVQKSLQILDKVGIGAGILGTAIDYYLNAICDTFNKRSDLNQLSLFFLLGGTPSSSRTRAVQENIVDAELMLQKEVPDRIKRLTLPVFESLKDFNETVAPTLNNLKETWDRVEKEIEGVFDGIEKVTELFAPFDPVFDALSFLDCSDVPVLSYGKIQWNQMFVSYTICHLISLSYTIYPYLSHSACEAVDFANDLLEELFDAIGLGNLIDSLEDKVLDALGLPTGFDFDLPLDGLIKLDLDNYLPNLDDVLLEFRQKLFEPFQNPIERINKAVETATDQVNSANPNSYDIKTVLAVKSPDISFNCDAGTIPIVATATYIGPNCIDDKLDGVWRIPCDGTESSCTKNYLNPDTRLTCTTQSLDSYTSQGKFL